MEPIKQLLHCVEQKHRRRHRRLRKTTPRPDAVSKGGEAEREEVPEAPVFLGREDTEAENLELGMAERLDEKKFQVCHTSTYTVRIIPSPWRICRVRVPPFAAIKSFVNALLCIRTN